MPVLSESEHRKLWCPMARVVVGETLPAGNRGPMGRSIFASDPPGGPAGCLGSGCGMWEWVEPAAECISNPDRQEAAIYAGRVPSDHTGRALTQGERAGIGPGMHFWFQRSPGSRRGVCGLVNGNRKLRDDT